MKTLARHFKLILISSASVLLVFPIITIGSERLSGQWKGRWDNLYQCRFNITLTDDNNYLVVYQWEENKGQAFSKNEHTGKKVNSNTILANNIYIVSHPNDQNRAIALGIFDQKTRMAYLKRVKGK